MALENKVAGNSREEFRPLPSAGRQETGQNCNRIWVPSVRSSSGVRFGYWREKEKVRHKTQIPGF